jgi:hypothetical protein
LAFDSLSQAVTELLATDDWGDLDWLSPDFAQTLTDASWDHRADFDDGRFERAVKSYLKEIAPDETKS